MRPSLHPQARILAQLNSKLSSTFLRASAPLIITNAVRLFAQTTRNVDPGHTYTPIIEWVYTNGLA